MAEEAYAAYVYHFGFPPANPRHLKAFSLKVGVKVTWPQCKNIMKEAPDVSDYVPDDKSAFNTYHKTKKKDPATTDTDKSNTNKSNKNGNYDANAPAKVVNKRTSTNRFHFQLAQLIAQGWQHDIALKALKANNGNLHLALEWLMNNTATNANNAAPKKKLIYVKNNENHPGLTSGPKKKTIWVQNNNNDPGLTSGPKKKLVHVNNNNDHSLIPGPKRKLIHVNNNNNDPGLTSGPKKKLYNQTPQQTSDYANNYNKNNNQPKPQAQNNDYLPTRARNSSLATLIEELKAAFNTLFNGGAINQKLFAMNKISSNLAHVDINNDAGLKLLNAFALQILDEDYIYHEYKVRTKAIEAISDIFKYLLNTLSSDKCREMIDSSLEEILNNLFMILDNNKSRAQHNITQQCIDKIVDYIINMANNKSSMVTLCSILNEKVNSEQMYQPKTRLFAFKQLCKIVFGSDNAVINNIINKGAALNLSTGVVINNNTDLPQDQHYLNLINTNVFGNDDDETFKDIFMDCISLMMMDPNRDNQMIANNIAVFMSQLNNNFKDGLEIEAKHRFNKFYKAKPNTSNIDDLMSPTPANYNNANNNNNNQFFNNNNQQYQPQQRQQSQSVTNSKPNNAYNNVSQQQPQQRQQSQSVWNANTKKASNPQQINNNFQKHWSTYQQYKTDQQNNGGADYRIHQQTAVSVAAPTLPDI